MQAFHLSTRRDDASRRDLGRIGCALVAGLLALVAGGCQSYERRPLDMSDLHAAFMSRTPENPEVRAFARTLRPGSAASPAGAASAFDPADGIACNEAEVIALVFNADLRMARLKAGVTRATAENSGLWEDPTIGVDLARIVESTPEPWKVFASAGITIPVSGRLGIEKQRAGAQHAAELARVAQREWSVRMDVRRGWSEWSALEARLAATREFLGRVEQILAVVEKMEQAGEMARTEARLFRIERAAKAAEFAVLESQVRQGELRLRQLMGVSPAAPLRLHAAGVGTGRAIAGPIADVPEFARRSPAVLVAAAEYEAAEKALELEVRKQYPDVHVGPGYGREDGQDQILLGLSLPVPILNANRRGIAEARAQREVARAGVEGTLEQTIGALRASELRLEAAAQRRRTFETEIVPLVDAQYADAREVARLGEVNTLVLLESLTRQHEAKIGLIDAARDEAIAAADLEEIIGPEIIGTLHAPVPPPCVDPAVNPNTPTTTAARTAQGSAR